MFQAVAQLASGSHCSRAQRSERALMDNKTNNMQVMRQTHKVIAYPGAYNYV